MANPFFRFKQFTVFHNLCAMKVGTDGVILGAWTPLCGNENRILDIGTGSGLIALMLAQRTTHAEITAIDIAPEATQQAEINFAASKWNRRLRATTLSVQELSRKEVIPYDLIVSNPPYFVNSLKNPQQNRSVARHTDTLTFDELANSAYKLLSPKGYFCVILPIEGAEQLTHIAQAIGFFLTKKVLVFPKPEVNAKRCLLCFGKKEESCKESTLTIETQGRHIYSDEYKKLTEDFYL